MTQQRIDENPFDLTKASDFSDSQILDYWVDLAGDHGLLTILKPKLIMPMMLLGGKGSGKTHLMRYCSSSVQAMRNSGSLFQAVNKEGYLGIYVHANGLRVGRFLGKGQPDDVWSTIFCYYFEVWLTINLVSAVRNYLTENEPLPSFESDFAKKAALLFDTPVSDEFNSVNSFHEYLINIQKLIDFEVNNCAITRSLNGIIVNFTPGKLMFGIPKLLSELIPNLSNTIFVYLIDEVETFTEGQQRFLNTLIRYREGNTSIKIGSRLYGIKTYETIGTSEPIKQNSEYERVELDRFLRGHSSEYKSFVNKLIENRLKQHGFTIPEEGVASCFNNISSENFYQESTLKLVASYDKKNTERPYFKKLRTNITQICGKGSDEIVNRIIEKIRFKEYPLLEKVNILLIYKSWGNLSELTNIADKISEECHNFLNKGKTAAPDYFQVYDHFDSDLLAQLYRDCKTKVNYCGLDTLIHLSQGIPRNLLGILKQIYRRSLFSGEKPFAGGIISVQSQTEGVMDSSAWFWDDAQPDSHGVEVREAVKELADLFRMVRYSDKPAECDLCTFSIDINGLTENSRKMLQIAENWSYLIRVRDGAKNKNDNSVDYKFQISPMLAPTWGISAHRRGTIEIKSDLGNAIFDQTCRGKLNFLRNKRVEGMIAPRFSNLKISQQSELF